MNWGLVVVDSGDNLLVDIDVDNLVAEVCEAGRDGGTDVAAAEN